MTAADVLVVDDSKVMRDMITACLRPDPRLTVTHAASGLEAIERLSLKAYDVLVLDLNMPGEETLPAIPALAPQTAIVVLTMQRDPVAAREALQAGARGYVLKDAAQDELVEAIRLAAAGRTYLNPELGARIAATPPPAGPPDDLTPRELEVLRLLALGHTNAEIAQQLFLSPRTVETYRAQIQRKAGRSTRAELTRYALDHGLFAPD